MNAGAWVALVASAAAGLLGLVVFVALVCHCGRQSPPRWPYALAAVITGLPGAAGGVCLAAMAGVALYGNSGVSGDYLGLDNGLGQLAFMGVLALVAGVPIGAGMGGWVGVWMVEMVRGESSADAPGEG